MLLASSSYSYPLLGAFWTILMIFLWVIWFWILITVFIDLFRSHDLSGWSKALWFIFILFLPLIGVLVYLIARGGKMHEHAVRDAQVQEQQFRGYVQEAAGSASPADQLAKLADLRDRGVRGVRPGEGQDPGLSRTSPACLFTVGLVRFPPDSS
jgi:type VI protein secretion system component VasK